MGVSLAVWRSVSTTILLYLLSLSQGLQLNTQAKPKHSEHRSYHARPCQLEIRTNRNCVCSLLQTLPDRG